ncbi:HpcH/HpaI aldolase family protein [Microbacterium immunditiarum]|uniref:4-hydroxy-2-oxoheptanedioate aldolase n=1 Tax=Microbacterium immunditiarum TaxID=337480 RepID=A0A7Y9KHN5_9MICO|nr:aldolase/citrate lyase family protein [Microbacterium immunditiarum]NYE19657.1 4-hydroxy-2-oxoheptanedioate aldolase [Microbacterium immunditiarum]
MPVLLSEFAERQVNTTAEQWRARLAAGEPVFGLWVASGSATAAEILGGSGADWIIIDCEHSANHGPAVIEQLRALSLSPALCVVRPSSKEPAELGRMLDAGAGGLMAPMVESVSEAEEVVAATRYAPVGRRGVGGGFARAARWAHIADYLPNAERTFSLIVQVESAAGLAVAGDIATVPGVDAVFIGPADLAASLGYPGQARHPVVQAAIDGAIRAVRAAGAVAGVNAFAFEDAERYRAAGAQLLAVGADVTILMTEGAGAISRHRAAAASEAVPSK